MKKAILKVITLITAVIAAVCLMSSPFAYAEEISAEASAEPAATAEVEIVAEQRNTNAAESAPEYSGQAESATENSDQTGSAPEYSAAADQASVESRTEAPGSEDTDQDRQEDTDQAGQKDTDQDRQEDTDQEKSASEDTDQSDPETLVPEGSDPENLGLEESESEEAESEELDSEDNDSEDNESEDNDSEEEAPAKSGTCGESISWELNESGILTINGTGNMDDYLPEESPWFKSREDIISVVIRGQVTGIGEYAFAGLSELTKVSLPISISLISENAFEGAEKLEIVNYGGTETASEAIVIGVGNEPLLNARWNYKSSEIIDGFNRINGVWGWYKNGNLMTGLTGIIKGTMGTRTAWYYVRNGIFTQVSGITKKAEGTDNRWYFVKDGIFTKASGLAKRADESNKVWYYVANGVYTRATGLAKRADGSNNIWYYAENGVFTKSTGIAQRADGANNKWYYVQDGILTKASGLVQRIDGRNSKWYLVINGVLTKETGVSKKADNSIDELLYYVENGVQTSATGIAKRVDGVNTKWYYMEDGVLSTATGIAKRADGANKKWYYVFDGVFTKVTCVAKKADGSSSARYYVNNGVFDSSFTGVYLAYTIKSGKVTKIKTSGKGWRCLQNDLYYYTSSSACARDGYKTIDGVRYLFDYSGKLLKDAIVSPLTTSVHATDKYYYREANDITRITLHHMAGVSSGSSCAYYFCTNGLTNSANYCIGSEGDISCNVVENFGSWTSSNNYNDRRSICIELSDGNSSFTKMTDETIESLINLCVDLITRYPSLGGSFNYQEDGTGNITLHRMFSNTDCPGDWLISKLPWIQQQVNQRLGLE